MRVSSQLPETRTEVIFRHTSDQLRETRTSMQSFSIDVVEAYHDRVSPAARTVAFKTSGDHYRCVQTNAERLARYMDDDTNVRMPVDLEEAWVLSLKEPYQGRCVRDLARRYGLLGVSDDKVKRIHDVSSISRLTTEFGEAVQAMAPLLDGDEVDDKVLQHALDELQDLAGAALSMQDKVRKRLNTKLEVVK